MQVLIYLRNKLHLIKYGFLIKKIENASCTSLQRISQPSKIIIFVNRNAFSPKRLKTLCSAHCSRRICCRSVRGLAVSTLGNTASCVGWGIIWVYRPIWVMLCLGNGSYLFVPGPRAKYQYGWGGDGCVVGNIIGWVFGFCVQCWGKKPVGL